MEPALRHRVDEFVLASVCNKCLIKVIDAYWYDGDGCSEGLFANVLLI